MSLDDKLKRDGPLDVQTAVRVCTDVAAGLEALWGAGMVHRDVKPANILLDESGRAYITDFGLAKDTQGSLLTLPGQALGSMDYMAPEQIRGEPVERGHRHLRAGLRDVRVHVRASAVRRGPGHADPVGAPAGPPARSAQRPRRHPREFSQTLLVALEKDAAKRPQSAGEYARMLADAAG